MNLTKYTMRIFLAIALMAFSFSACKKFQGDVTVPAYIHIDSIKVTPQEHNAPSSEPGFYTSKIDAVQLIGYFEGDNAETNIGVFQLPCTAPVLRHGKMKYLHVIPAIKQNGSSATRIYYPFYQTINIDTAVLYADSVLNFGNLETHYYTRQNINVLTEDYFEPTIFSSHFDSTVVWVSDPENACTGQGYGLIHIPDTVKNVNFEFIDEFNIPNNYLYLEMDYITDVELYINMIGHEVSSSGNTSIKSIMCLNPNKQWNKIYINLGRTWSQFYYTTPFKIYFQAVNTEGKEANVKIDNVKILTVK